MGYMKNLAIANDARTGNDYALAAAEILIDHISERIEADARRSASIAEAIIMDGELCRDRLSALEELDKRKDRHDGALAAAVCLRDALLSECWTIGNSIDRLHDRL